MDSVLSLLPESTTIISSAILRRGGRTWLRTLAELQVSKQTVNLNIPLLFSKMTYTIVAGKVYLSEYRNNQQIINKIVFCDIHSILFIP
jgi:hypothetical protein